MSGGAPAVVARGLTCLPASIAHGDEVVAVVLAVPARLVGQTDVGMVAEVLKETEHLLEDVVGGLCHAPAEKAEGERPVAARVGDEVARDTAEALAEVDVGGSALGVASAHAVLTLSAIEACTAALLACRTGGGPRRRSMSFSRNCSTNRLVYCSCETWTEPL